MQRSGMSNVLYAILAMALVTSVGAGVAIHAMDSESPENLVTVEGTVTAVDWNPHFNESVELTLTDRKSTRLNSSHSQISYAVFCLKKKKMTSPTHDVSRGD